VFTSATTRANELPALYTQQHGENVTWEIVKTKQTPTPVFDLF
jgi:hypothetical protein